MLLSGLRKDGLSGHEVNHLREGSCLVEDLNSLGEGPGSHPEEGLDRLGENVRDIEITLERKEDVTTLSAQF